MKNVLFAIPLALFFVACGAKAPEARNIYYKDVEVVDRVVATKCNAEIPPRPADLDTFKAHYLNQGGTYSQRALALKKYLQVLEAYNESVESVLKSCVE